MPQECTRCHRPNGDHARQCLYCGWLLHPGEQTAADDSEAQAGGDWPESHTVVVVHDVATLSPDSFANLTGRPAAWLEDGTPLIADTLPDREAADALHQSLSDAGIASVLVDDSKLGELGTTVDLRTASLVDDRLQLTARNGRTWSLAPADIVLMVEAFIADPEQPDGSHFLRRKSPFGKIETVVGGSGEIHVLDLFTRDHPPFRIVGERFAYEILGPARTPLAVDNFGILIELLRELAPDARLDEAFRLRETRFRRPVHVGPNSDINRLNLYGRRLVRAVREATALPRTDPGP